MNVVITILLITLTTAATAVALFVLSAAMMLAYYTIMGRLFPPEPRSPPPLFLRLQPMTNGRYVRSIIIPPSYEPCAPEEPLSDDEQSLRKTLTLEFYDSYTV